MRSFFILLLLHSPLNTVWGTENRITLYNDAIYLHTNDTENDYQHLSPDTILDIADISAHTKFPHTKNKQAYFLASDKLYNKIDLLEEEKRYKRPIFGLSSILGGLSFYSGIMNVLNYTQSCSFTEDFCSNSNYLKATILSPLFSIGSFYLSYDLFKKTLVNFKRAKKIPNELARYKVKLNKVRSNFKDKYREELEEKRENYPYASTLASETSYKRYVLKKTKIREENDFVLRHILRSFLIIMNIANLSQTEECPVYYFFSGIYLIGLFFGYNYLSKQMIVNLKEIEKFSKQLKRLDEQRLLKKAV